MNLFQECKDAKKIGIGGHIRPDGDCVGSCLALYLYLTKRLPDTYIKVFLEKPSDAFNEIKGYDQIDSSCKEDTVFDIFIIVDSTDDRMGEARKYFESARRTINIDHHVSNQGCGSINYIESAIGSASELVYDLIDKDFLDQEIAKALYVGMIHDTGIFQYASTTPETMEKAAHLMRFGLDFPRLIEETFYQKSYIQSQILGRALMESILIMDGKCVVSYLNRKTMKFYGVNPIDLESIVSHLRYIKGVDCAIFLYQTGVQEYKVSLRGNEKLDVSKIATIFGGGGHVRAAGCTMSGTVHDCVNNLSAHIEKQLNGNP